MRLLMRLPLNLLSIRWRFLFLLLCTCAVLLSASVYRALDRRAADVAAAMADGVEHARRAERPSAAQEGGVERADLRCDGAVEAADAGDRIEHDI